MYTEVNRTAAFRNGKRAFSVPPPPPPQKISSFLQRTHWTIFLTPNCYSSPKSGLYTCICDGIIRFGGTSEHLVVHARLFLSTSNWSTFPFSQQIFRWLRQSLPLKNIASIRDSALIALSIHHICLPVTFVCGGTRCNVSAFLCEFCSQTEPCCCCKLWIYWNCHFRLQTIESGTQYGVQLNSVWNELLILVVK